MALAAIAVPLCAWRTRQAATRADVSGVAKRDRGQRERGVCMLFGQPCPACHTSIRRLGLRTGHMAPWPDRVAHDTFHAHGGASLQSQITVTAALLLTDAV